MTDDGQHYGIDDFEHYMQVLKMTAYGLLRGINSPSLRPSDLVQDALGREPNKTWRDEQHFLHDTRRKMKQALIDHLRRKNAARRQAPLEEVSTEPDSFGWTPSTQYGMDELQAKLNSLRFILLSGSQTPDMSRLAFDWPDQMEEFLEALAGLEISRPGWAEIVELRVFTGLTFEQIAGVTGLSEKTVRSHWTLAKGVLQPSES